MPITRPAHRLTFYVKGAEWVQHALTEPKLKDLGLSFGQLAILRAIADVPRCTAADLARRSGARPQSTGETVAVLIRKGLVLREEVPANRKRLQLAISPQGAAVLSEAEAILEAIEQELTTGLDPRQVEAAKQVLAAIMARFSDGAGQGG